MQTGEDRLLHFFKRNKENKGLVGLAAIDQGFAVARVTGPASALELQDCAVLDAEPRARAKVLADAVERADLRGARCNFILGSADYNLLLVEAPKVQADELSAAVRWRIKDLIDRPVDELAIDTFPLPAGSHRGQGDMLYVVAARKSRIVEIRDMTEEAGLTLEAIDIPELAMLNLSVLHSDDSNGLAFIDFRASGSTLNLSKGGVIHLSRHLNTVIAPDSTRARSWETLRERLVLEIQRSLDYFESQMGQGQISRLLVAPRADAGDLAVQLNEAMGVRVEMLDLAQCLDADIELPLDLQHDCLLAIGGALRGRRATERAAA